MLEIKNLEVFYGSIQALRGISLEVGDQEIISIIGANGAGKSTTMNAVAGIKPYKNGQIIFNGEDLTGQKNDKIVKSGIILCPEGRQIFSRMSVEENLDIGAYIFAKEGAENKRRMQIVYDFFPRLYERRTQSAGTLSGGEQQMLAIGRSLMSRPKLLMLDEPSLGLAPIIVQQIFQLLVEIYKEENLPILLVEQNAHMALGISHRTYVLSTGEIIMEGRSADMRNDPKVQDAYL